MNLKIYSTYGVSIIHKKIPAMVRGSPENPFISGGETLKTTHCGGNPRNDSLFPYNILEDFVFKSTLF